MTLTACASYPTINRANRPHPGRLNYSEVRTDMGENAVPVHPYFIYAGVSFVFLVMIAMLAALLRLMFLVGRMDGRLIGVESAVADLRQEMAGHREEMASLREEMAGHRQEMANLRGEMANIRQEVANIWNQLGNLREAVAENRGLLRALHERIDLVMRHRHDPATGNVVLPPTEPTPEREPVAD